MLSLRVLASYELTQDRRVAKIEMIDEVEELNLVLEHYAITWGSVGAPKIGLQTR